MEPSKRISEIEGIKSPDLGLYAYAYVLVRRKNVTLHLQMKENTKIFTLKKMIEGVFKIQPADQQLFLVYVNGSDLDEYRELSESDVPVSKYGLIPTAAKLTDPAIVGLAERQEDGSFEKLEITPYSIVEGPKLSSSNPPTAEEMEEIAVYRERYERMAQKLLEAKPGSSTSK